MGFPNLFLYEGCHQSEWAPKCSNPFPDKVLESHNPEKMPESPPTYIDDDDGGSRNTMPINRSVYMHES